MTNPFEDESSTFLVLVNSERQYSLWPDFLAIPPGWSAVGPHATRSECLTWIEKHWTDMRPLSLVRQMEGPEPRIDSGEN
jgi:uncharacterized protein YbdZ (MbtH family)